MSGYTFDTMFPTLSETKLVITDFLDQPAADFLKDKTIEQILNRSYNTIFYQTTIDATNLAQIKDVIHAITVWQVYGAYMNSMSDNLQDTNKFEFMNKLKHYKMIAVGLGNLLGLDVTGEKTVLDTTQVVAGGVGMSVYKDTDYFTGAADNIV